MVDMGTLADLLRGLAEGRNIDTTPFGTWGVRDMDPGRLGALMSGASKIRQENLGDQMKLMGTLEMAKAHASGSEEQANAARLGHELLAQTSANQLKAAPEAARLAQEAAQKRAETTGYYGMKGHEATGQAHIKAAEIGADAKTGKLQPIPPLVLQQMLAQLSAPDAKPAQVAINLAALEASNYNTAPLKQALADIRAEKEAKKAEAGPGWWGNSEPGPPLMRSGSLGEDLYKLRQQRVLPSGDYDDFKNMM